MRRVGSALAAFVGLALSLFPAGTAFADAAQPTDYRSQIVSVTPMVPGLEVSIEGGDSFVRLRAPEGVEVVVLGYVNEPYLLIAADGTVSHNLLSAATYENQRRYGATEVPSFVDHTADPQWEQIADGATWAWHDHRAHWMDDEPPVGLEPGDSLPTQLIPVFVDGAPVSILVETTLIGPPSPAPALIGALLGLQLVVLGWWLGPATATLTTLVVSLGALVAGGGQFLSLPPETDPKWIWWVLPAAALVAGIAAIATYGRSRELVVSLLAISGLQLAVWAFVRRTTLTKPVLPTDLPYWFDRAATAAALTGGTVVALLAVWALLRPATTADANTGPTETSDA